MRRPILPSVTLDLVLEAPTGAAEKVAKANRFQLWNGCKPVDLLSTNVG